MNYGFPFEPINYNQGLDYFKLKMLEEEILRLKKDLNILEQRITSIENKQIKKDNPQFLNSTIDNKNDGLYMI